MAEFLILIGVALLLLSPFHIAQSIIQRVIWNPVHLGAVGVGAFTLGIVTVLVALYEF